jgi:predicted esterase
LQRGLGLICLPLVLSLLASCASLRSEYGQALEFGQQSGLSAQILQTPNFPLLTQVRIKQVGNAITVYIEGDGAAWKSRSELSTDPTPITPLALKLAALDPAPNVAWLARPCQYLLAQSPRCRSDYWNTQRYSSELAATIDSAINQLKAQAGANRVHLVGYSGGATMALLIAARRSDVSRIYTVAGNLDTEAFTTHHGVTPFPSQDNPLGRADKLAAIPQIHWFGQDDSVIPPKLAARYASTVGVGHCVSTQTVANATHASGWEQRWPDLLNTPLPCTTR